MSSADYRGVSLDATLARITQLQAILSPPAVPAAPAPAVTASTGATGLAPTHTFASALQAADAPVGAAPVSGAGGTVRQAIVADAAREVGVAEQPPGSNDGPRIAQYRTATQGAGVGPWCAYFVSWVARQAGAPIGDHGQGFGAVQDVWSWAQSSGRSMPAGSRPDAGDLIVWPEHIGIVSSVDPDGTIHTIEGNSSDQVARRTYGADGGGAIGYVRIAA